MIGMEVGFSNKVYTEHIFKSVCKGISVQTKMKPHIFQKNYMDFSES